MDVTDRLSGLDSSFLHLERDGTHMHVASTTIFEGPAPPYVEFRDHIASRLHLVPRFRQKLRFVPFGQGRPVWVDDPHLNLTYHVRHTSLPEPGSEQQLRVLAARIFSEQLDRSKPLWELWLIEGLKGDRFAIVGKTHHAMVDGVSGVDITTVLFDCPEGAERTAESARALGARSRAEPCPAALGGSRPARDRPARGDSGRPPSHARARGARCARPRRRSPPPAPSPGPASPLPGARFNFDVGPHRRFAWVRASLADMKLVKNELGGTVNDVILAAVAGALGRYCASAATRPSASSCGRWSRSASAPRTSTGRWAIR